MSGAILRFPFVICGIGVAFGRGSAMLTVGGIGCGSSLHVRVESCIVPPSVRYCKELYLRKELCRSRCPCWWLVDLSRKTNRCLVHDVKAVSSAGVC